MPLTSKWVFILVGNDKTGKTTVQKGLVELLSGQRHPRLPSNQGYEITHPRFARKCARFFVAGRSYQELRNKGNGYKSVKEYFERKIDSLDVAFDLVFIASHLDDVVIKEMIRESHRRFWNACGIFLTNSISSKRQDNVVISELPWDERWMAENAFSDNPETRDRQLRRVTETIVETLAGRTRGW